ncbi:ATP synthase-coupling factor 6, mitochondrial [Eumeta japonica]|uniref:ATP synthase-coupling factor 6, mitochondrial n=1 Tax=Eumeta variegata TaxID=151549 RepID=A0A4C1V203_EUMVA|nr:ATP synthase-coupling factor 6, mitochondrial [Eumeta japonica]
MLSSSLIVGLRAAKASILPSRHLAAAASATDPIQKLFLDKIREYKSKSGGGKLVDVSPEIQKELKTELEKLEKQYGGGAGVDMTAFPDFKFDEPKLDPIDEQEAAKK